MDTLTDSASDAVRGGDVVRRWLSVVYHVDDRRIGQRRHLIQGEALTLGRGGDALGAGALEDRRLSRDHVQLVVGRGVAVRDLGSRNGTFVNGAAVTEAVLEPGDVLAIGSLLLLLGESAREPVAAPRTELVGVSERLGRALHELAVAAPRDATVLLRGETGVGKELFARELHRLSGRPGALVSVNCGALAPGLLHSELFGHARGAYTGAQGARDGLVREAAGGTLFLDEIGDAEPRAQVALLRLLETRRVRPVGGEREHEVDVRFVAATHRDLRAMVVDGTFRQDLLMRLQRWAVDIPALRERREDLPLLAAHFVERFSGRRVPLSRALVVRLLDYPWPGNVRELEGVIERLVAGAGSDAARIDVADWLQEALRPPPEPARPPTAPSRDRAPHDHAPEPPRPDADQLRATLARHRGNVSAVARSVGVSRNTLYRWLRDDDIDPSGFRRG